MTSLLLPQVVAENRSSGAFAGSSTRQVVLFNSYDASGINGLWVTDGTAAGTHELTGISGAPSGGVSPWFMTVFNGEVLFNGLDSSGNNGLWVTDGTAAGTRELTGVSGANLAGVVPRDLTAFNGEVLFEGSDASGYRGLWVTDGTLDGTHELTGISGAYAAGLFFGFHIPAATVFNGKVLFSGFDASGQYGLWMTNGTAAGTHELTGINGADADGLFADTQLVSMQFNPDLTVFNGQALFDGNDASGNHGLWVTDGTAAGTHELTGISGAYSDGLFSGFYTPDLTVFNGEVLFEGRDAGGNYGLWVTNGTAAGTHELTGISGAYSAGLFSLTAESLYSNMVVSNGQVLFGGEDVSGTPGLWATDGTAAGTHEVSRLAGIAGAYSGPLFLTPFTLSVPTIVESISANPGSGDLGPGGTVTLTLNFSEAVTVASGTPALALNDGGVAAYQSNSGTNALVFIYTVGGFGSGENTPDLALAAANAVVLNGATITDASGTAVDLSGANGYNPAGVLVVDTTPSIELPFSASATHHGQLGAVIAQSYGEGDHGGPGSNSFDHNLYYSIDFDLDLGTPVLAEGQGTVVYVSDGTPNTQGGQPTYQEDPNHPGTFMPIPGQEASLRPHNLGNYITVKYDDGYYATYAHLSPGVSVQVGDTVNLGEQLARVGDTGAFTGTHLHVTYGVGSINLGTQQHPDIIADGSFADNPNPPVQFYRLPNGPHDSSKSVIGDNTQSVAGRVSDGYLSGATVFADANGNGQLDPGEIFTTTDANGHFTLTGGAGPLVVTGGTDASIGRPFTGLLEGPAGSTTITPLTTLVTALQRQGIGDAEAQVLASFGLDPSTDLLDMDPIAATLGGDPNGAKAYVAGAQVMDTVTMIDSALASIGVSTNSAEIFDALANLIKQSQGAINLTNVDFLNQLIITIEENLHESVSSLTAVAIATTVAASNSAQEKNATQLTGQMLIDSVGAVERVAQSRSWTLTSTLGSPAIQLLEPVSENNMPVTLGGSAQFGDQPLVYQPSDAESDVQDTSSVMNFGAPGPSVVPTTPLSTLAPITRRESGGMGGSNSAGLVSSALSAQDLVWNDSASTGLSIPTSSAQMGTSSLTEWPIPSSPSNIADLVEPSGQTNNGGGAGFTPTMATWIASGLADLGRGMGRIAVVDPSLTVSSEDTVLTQMPILRATSM